MVDATLYLLNYNNYYNRIVKKEDTLSDYLQYQLGEAIEGVNFIPNDYVDTQQVVNWKAGNPNYLLVVDEAGNINSRWFVITTHRIRGGQLQLTLRRDLAVDYYDDFISSPAFVEKGYPTNIDDPAIYNNENISFNQIKKLEIPLKDKSGISWIVGYIPRDAFSSDKTTDKENGIKVQINYNYSGSQDYEVDSLSDYEYYGYTQNNNFNIITPDDPEYTIVGSVAGTHQPLLTAYDQPYNFTLKMNSNGGKVSYSDENAGSGPYKALKVCGTTAWSSGQANYINSSNYGERWTYGSIKNRESFVSNIISKFPGSAAIKSLNNALFSSTANVTVSATMFDKLKKEDGKIIYSNEDKSYYRISLVDLSDGVEITSSYKLTSANTPTAFNLINNNINRELGVFKSVNPDSTVRVYGTADVNTYSVKVKLKTYKLVFTLLASQIYCMVPEASKRYHLNDSPYDMFCIPFPDKDKTVPIFKGTTTYISKVDRASGFNLATQIATASVSTEGSGGSASIYDVQLLPYCPFPSIIEAPGVINIGDTLSQPIMVQKLDNSGNPVGAAEIKSVVIWCLSSEFSFDIDFNLSGAWEYSSTPILQKKVENEAQKFRLCSPNYSGLFDFSVAKNNGVNGFHVDCNYKPYSPYIHVSPIFNQTGLYGGNFNDSRGLVCGGDFSLPQITSAWADYQLNNKNYQQMFNRQLDNMEVNNAVQREKESWQIAANTLSAATQGFTSGLNTTGNLAGGAIGGLASGGISLAAGLRDKQLNEQLRKETIDYTKDMFGYQLQNIQALPAGLAKVSAFTANNKIFPFIEMYECTGTEVQALKNKLKYNGFTIMRIGTLGEFVNHTETDYTYVKGQLIRVPDSLQEDDHIAVALANELFKGVFI